MSSPNFFSARVGEVLLLLGVEGPQKKNLKNYYIKMSHTLLNTSKVTFLMSHTFVKHEGVRHKSVNSLMFNKVLDKKRYFRQILLEISFPSGKLT